MNHADPVANSERIASLDVLRGFALLGILIMNIQSFSMPGAAYLNPTAYGDLSGINLWTWVISHIVADQKFLSVFSMLFGAGICLFADRAEAKYGKSAGLHYRRTFWLLVFGLVHAYALWYGDILVSYALCGFLVYLFRNRSPTTLFVLGVVAVSIPSLLYLLTNASLDRLPEETIAEIMSEWRPDAEALAAEISAYQGNWMDQMPYRAEDAFYLQTAVFFIWFLWRAGGMMLMGMAFYKWGIFSARRSDPFYRNMLFASLIAGYTLIGYGLVQNFGHGFAMEYSLYLGSQFNYWGSVLVSIAYVALVMLAVRRKLFMSFQRRLSAVGKTAFSNYILHSVLCTLIFYGHGLGLFGDVVRYQQMLVLFGIWIIQLWITPLWLERFRFGPLEWAWRSLTYWHIQPMKLSRP